MKNQLKKTSLSYRRNKRLVESPAKQEITGDTQPSVGAIKRHINEQTLEVIQVLHHWSLDLFRKVMIIKDKSFALNIQSL